MSHSANGGARKDRLPWMLLPGILLTLGGVTVLAPSQAAPPSSPKPAVAAFDDGDGDELLEHWGDPKYSVEERLQLAGMAGAFLVLGALTCRTRLRGRVRAVRTPALEETTEQRKAA